MPTPPLGVTAVMLPELDFDQQIERCVELNLTHYVYRPRVIADHQRDSPYSNWGNHRFDLTPQRLADEGPQLADRLEAAGLTPFGTVPNTADAHDEDLFKLHLQGAAAARAANMRIALPPLSQGLFDWAAYLAACRDTLARMIDLAAPFDIKLVIEMHAGSPAVDPVGARNLCEGFDPQHLGLIFDLPNLSREGIRHAALSVAAAAAYIDHAHVGGFTYLPPETTSKGDSNQQPQFRGRDADGFAEPVGTMAPLTDNDLHAPTWLRLLLEAVPHCPLIIEDYTPDKPATTRLTDTAAALRRALPAD
ncbi:MAG: TIM barrel protein [Planctomycetota bacterium]